MGTVVITVAAILVMLTFLFLLFLDITKPVPQKSIVPAPGDSYTVFRKYDPKPLQAEIIKFIQDDPGRVRVKWFLIKVPIYKDGLYAGHEEMEHPFECLYDRYQSCGTIVDSKTVESEINYEH
jgi:hypothetical protein